MRMLITRWLHWLGLRNDILFCMHKDDVWTWGDKLGEATEGKCMKCGECIVYERQNYVFKRKVCSRCAGYVRFF